MKMGIKKMTVLLMIGGGLLGCQAPATNSISDIKATIHATSGNTVSGYVLFTQVKEGVRVKASINGLTPGPHGMHIHEYGDCSDPQGKSAGGHYNPDKHPHSGPNNLHRHVGDLGNIVANKDGHATLMYVDAHLSKKGLDMILGRGVIIHEKEDDLTSQPTGAAGTRVGCGVIGLYSISTAK